MPVRKVGKHNELDVIEFSALMTKHVTWADVACVVIEEPGGSQNAAAASVMSGVFHALRAYMELYQRRWKRITPQSWQNELLGKNREKGMTKALALAAAQAKWPAHKWTATDRAVKPHEGLVDAALISEYGRIKGL